MARAWLAWLGRGIVLRMVTLIVVVGVVVGPAAPAQAGIHWSSTDPLFTFEYAGVLESYGLDVQLMVPADQLPLLETAVLNVTVPSNVRGRVVNPPNPLVPLEVEIKRRGADADTPRFMVDFVVLVAPAPSAFPIQLLITDPHDVRVYAVEGKAGKPLRATVEVGR